MTKVNIRFATLSPIEIEIKQPMKMMHTSRPAVPAGTMSKPKIAIVMVRLLALLSIVGCGHEESSNNSTATNSSAGSPPASPAMPVPANTNMPPGTNSNPATNPASPP